MATLNHFISQLGEKGLPFFKQLKKTGKFKWIEEADQAFEKLKAYLTSSPVLTPPERCEDLMLYIERQPWRSAQLLLWKEKSRVTRTRYNDLSTTSVRWC